MLTSQDKYLRVAYEMMNLMQSKLLETRISDSGWTKRFMRGYSALSQLEGHNMRSTRLSQACQDLAMRLNDRQKKQSRSELSYVSRSKLDFSPHKDFSRHSSTLTDRLAFHPPRRPKIRRRVPIRRKESRYYNVLMDKLLKEERFKKQKTLPENPARKTTRSLMEERDFWLIDNNIQFIR